ncbi:hypothetical protein CDD83_2794 [Cordyceps sp. RAO-2017]|nr:hypothetical protein CDD83_2794 [Cordyceps sp. RAO-2017]
MARTAGSVLGATAESEHGGRRIEERRRLVASVGFIRGIRRLQPGDGRCSGPDRIRERRIRAHGDETSKRRLQQQWLQAVPPPGAAPATEAPVAQRHGSWSSRLITTQGGRTGWTRRAFRELHAALRCACRGQVPACRRQPSEVPERHPPNGRPPIHDITRNPSAEVRELGLEL